MLPALSCTFFLEKNAVYLYKSLKPPETMKKQHLMIILILVLISVIMTTVFSKIQSNRIEHLRKTLDSLSIGNQQHIDQKFFNADSSQ